MKKIIAALAMLGLAGCGSDGEAAVTSKPTKDDIISACKDGRVDIMAADADAKNLGADWPEDFKYTETKGGDYSATWNEGVGIAFDCTVEWDGKATDVTVKMR